MNWRQNPQRVAWLILIANFFACIALAVLVPLGIRSLVLYSSREQPAFAAALNGTAQLYASDAEEPIAITTQRPIEGGSRLVTDASSRALITVVTEGSSESLQALTTVQLFQDTSTELQRARRPRFDRSPDPYRVDLELTQGRIIVAAQSSTQRPVAVTVMTPQSQIVFSEGSFDIGIEGDRTQVRAQSGQATVTSQGKQVAVTGGERTEVAAGEAPAMPVSAALDLVLNGSFEGRISPPWQEIIEVAAGLPPGEIEVVEDGQRNALRFSRRAEDGAPSRSGVTQPINRDVQGYDTLTLRFDTKLMYQSVPGGGYLATEYPMMADIFYTDIYGKDLHWYQGLYYMDLPDGSTYLPPTGEKIPLGIWYTYESPNLYDLLQETRPARINSITLYASGHDYESLVSNVALTVR